MSLGVVRHRIVVRVIGMLTVALTRTQRVVAFRIRLPAAFTRPCAVPVVRRVVTREIGMPLVAGFGVIFMLTTVVTGGHGSVLGIPRSTRGAPGVVAFRIRRRAVLTGTGARLVPV